MIKLLRSLRRHPSAVRIVVRTRFVRDFQVVETVVGVRLAVVAVGVRQKVELANLAAAIAVVAQQARQGRRVLGHGHAHMRKPQCGWILPGEKAHAAGHADRVLHKAVVEIYSSSREPVQVRRADFGVAAGTESIPPLLIGVEDEDIGSLHGWRGFLADVVWMRLWTDLCRRPLGSREFSPDPTQKALRKIRANDRTQRKPQQRVDDLDYGNYVPDETSVRGGILDTCSHFIWTPSLPKIMKALTFL